MLLCCDEPVKLIVNWLPPLGRSVCFATFPVTLLSVGVILSVIPLSAVAQVNCMH